MSFHLDNKGHESDPSYNEFKHGSHQYSFKRLGRIAVAGLGLVGMSYVAAINQDHSIPLPGIDKVATFLHDIKSS